MRFAAIALLALVLAGCKTQFVDKRTCQNVLGEFSENCRGL